MFNLSSLFKSTAIALFSFMSIAICAGNANSPNPSIFVSGLCNNLNSWIQASQTRITVYGVVKEAGSNQPLVGVNVYIKGTTEGTITDSEGGYSLSLPDGKWKFRRKVTPLFSFQRDPLFRLKVTPRP